MSSDEEDYMSDKFLAGSTSDIRPGLVKNRAKQREIEVAAKKARIDEEHRKKVTPNARERLEEGLSNAISSDNKGFALLAKMGYKQGQSLGKTSDGILEPIAISVKSNRAGLGREAALRDLEEKKIAIRRKRLLEKSKGAEISTEEFRRRMTQKAEERSMELALGKCQRACEKLDETNNVEHPAISWFWPIRKAPNEETEEEDEEKDTKEEEEDDEIQYETSEKLEMLLNYLRTSYNYCHWCGVHYTDLSDLESNCPGPGKDDH